MTDRAQFRRPKFNPWRVPEKGILYEVLTMGGGRMKGKFCDHNGEMVFREGGDGYVTRLESLREWRHLQHTEGERLVITLGWGTGDFWSAIETASVPGLWECLEILIESSPRDAEDPRALNAAKQVRRELRNRGEDVPE